MFKATTVNKLNPYYTIDIKCKTITSGCRYWQFETIEELLEAIEELKREINSVLSDYEHKILVLFLQGYSYADIGKAVEKSVKSIDNAIQRIKKKVRPILNGN